MVGDTRTALGALMPAVNLTLEIVGTKYQPDIGFDILLDGDVRYSGICSDKHQQFDFSISDQPAEHQLEIVMKGKCQEHTECDDDGNILADSSLLIERWEIEGIDMKPIFCQGSPCYSHSHNDPTADLIQDEFYAFMGCNGRVTFQFYTPIYLWMSERF